MVSGFYPFKAPKTVYDREKWPPNYTHAFGWRQKMLYRYKSELETLAGAKEFYRTRPEQFINHWAVTYDPRNAGSDVPAKLPFVMFRRQAELIEFLHLLVKAQQSGLIEKSRDMGATWLCCAFSVWLWLFWPGAAVGWGSRKADLVDKLGDPDSIFEKMRMIVMMLPRTLWPAGFSSDMMSHMRFINPENGATVTGESGDNIGRGGRKLIYFKDESAHYERPEKIEAALGDNTNVQIDMSSVNGFGNVFHRRREAGVLWVPGSPVQHGKVSIFVMDWTDHPAKTQEWYDARKRKSIDDGLEHVFAQEVDRNYAASVEGVIIREAWLRAAIDAHVKLGLSDSGGWSAGLDVADEGADRNALAVRKGIVLKSVKEWGARDVGVTTRQALSEVEDLGVVDVGYDCIGIGAGVKSEVNRLCEDAET